LGLGGTAGNGAVELYVLVVVVVVHLGELPSGVVLF
jgi:hypothetical protein